MSKNSELKHGVQFTLTQIVATPGLVLWLFNWLVIVLFVIYQVLVTVNVTQTYTSSSDPAPAGSAPTTPQFVVAGLLALVVWYAIGFGVHLALSKLANRAEDPLKVYRILTVGGTIAGSVLVAIGVYVISQDIGPATGAIISGFIGVFSFGLQQLLAKIWNIELV